MYLYPHIWISAVKNTFYFVKYIIMFYLVAYLFIDTISFLGVPRNTW